MPHLMLSVFGSPQIELAGSAPPKFESDKVRALLIYLAINAGQTYRRDTLAYLLWPDVADRPARHNLSQALFNLRQAIRDQAADPPFLLISRATIAFNPASDYALDLAAFTGLLAACATHQHRQIETCGACAQRLTEAVALYHGDFLAAFTLADSVAFDEWALLEREQSQRRMLQALALLAAYHERRGAYDQSCAYARRQLALDPWREEAHRHLMRVLTLAGQRSAALEQYERCRQALLEGLSVEPEAETTALYRRIAAEDEASQSQELLGLPTLRPHNLPPQLTPFVGRETELAQLAERLANPACRLLTIVGPGGVGKTRLALQAAAEQIESFADGVWFVSLVGLHEATHLAASIADALHLPVTASEAPEARLLSGLGDKEVLLVLDNLEQLLAGIDLLATILERAPRVTILATSRARLDLLSEWLFELEGLTVPTAEGSATAHAYSAVELFVQTARRVSPGFAASPADLSAVMHICRSVDGLPLAIELAASWARLLSCAEIARELARSITFLSTTARDVPPRHRSLQAVFDHSWRLLELDEQRALRRLSVFRGGFRREAAETVAGASLTSLAALLGQSLLRKTIAGRYELHEQVRQYAATQLRSAQEEITIRDRHAEAMLALAEQAEPALSGPDQAAWLARLEEGRDNLRAAAQWALEQSATETALRLSGALWRFWDMHGHFTEGRRWLEQALALPAHDLQPALRLKAINGAGTLARRQSDYARSAALFEGGLALSRSAGERYWTAVLLNGLGLLGRRQGDFAGATARYEESLELSRALGNQRGVLAALGNLGSLARAQGDLDRAIALQEECLALSRQLGDQRSVAEDLNNLAVVLDAQGQFVRASALQQESLELYRALGDTYGVALVLYNLGTRAARGGASAQASVQLKESLALYHALGEATGCLDCLEQIAVLAEIEGQPRGAAQILGAAEGQRARLSAARTPAIQTDFDSAVAAVRCRLAPDVFAAAWAEGNAMTLEQAMAVVIAKHEAH